MDFSNFWWEAASAGPDPGPNPNDPGDPIGQSLRFRGAQNLTLSGTTLGNSFTLSYWSKDTQPTSAAYVWRTGSSGSVGANLFKQTNGDIQNSQLTQIVGTFRDPSAWSHFVYVRKGGSDYDVFVNGALRASFTDTGKANSGDFVWGVVEMYLAQAYLVEQELDPTTFGRINDNGVWVPVEPQGLTYGANGFHLTFEDPADLGKDYSGNDNHFTATGFEVIDQTSTTYDLVLDSPTQNWATATLAVADNQPVAMH